MANVEAEALDDVVIGTLLINSMPAHVLFDCGVSHSFVAKKFAKYLYMSLEWTDHPCRMAAPKNKILISHIKYPNCSVELKDRKLEVDLVQINTSDFDVIPGMDWLARHFVQIDCRGKKVLFMKPHEKGYSYQGNTGVRKIRKLLLLSAMQTYRAIKKRCDANLAYVIDTEKERMPLEKILVVKNFLDVFSDDFPSVPSDRKIEFEINIVPKVTPTSKASYRMVPAELKELKK